LGAAGGRALQRVGTDLCGRSDSSQPLRHHSGMSWQEEHGARGGLSLILYVSKGGNLPAIQGDVSLDMPSFSQFASALGLAPSRLRGRVLPSARRRHRAASHRALPLVAQGREA
jgi:hypothetical protein